MGKLSSLVQGRKKENEIRHVLSIDGGGIRGIIPAYILKKLSESLKSKGDEWPLYSHFDLIAGTSTGALLAAGLSIPQKPEVHLEKDEGQEMPLYHQEKRGFFRRSETILDGYVMRSSNPELLGNLYQEQGGRIFSRSPSAFQILSPIFSDKYDVRNLEAFMQECLGNTRMDELLCPTAIVSFETKRSENYVFRSYGGTEFLVREATRASTAAPVYFPPATLIDRRTGEKLVLVDGGLGANNPSMIAYQEALRLYPEADEIRMLSLSTCKSPFSTDPSKTSGGITSWAKDITRMYMSAQESTVNQLASCMPKLKYTRIYSNILEKRIPLDDVKPESINALLSYAETVYQNQKEEIDSYVEDLAASGPSRGIRLRRPDMPLLSQEAGSASF